MEVTVQTLVHCKLTLVYCSQYCCLLSCIVLLLSVLLSLWYWISVFGNATQSFNCWEELIFKFKLQVLLSWFLFYSITKYWNWMLRFHFLHCSSWYIYYRGILVSNKIGKTVLWYHYIQLFNVALIMADTLLSTAACSSSV